MKIYVGNLAYSASEDDLRKEFEAFGEVVSVNIVRDRITGNSRGFGFVQMGSKQEAQNAISALDGKVFQGRAYNVKMALPRPNKKSPGNWQGGNRGRNGRNFSQGRNFNRE